MCILRSGRLISTTYVTIYIFGYLGLVDKITSLLSSISRDMKGQ